MYLIVQSHYSDEGGGCSFETVLAASTEHNVAESICETLTLQLMLARDLAPATPLEKYAAEVAKIIVNPLIIEMRDQYHKFDDEFFIREVPLINFC